MNDQLLRTSLLDFMHALGGNGRGVLLGGGYGLYLKQLHRAQASQRTLLPVEVWPAPRATEDLDIMLAAEIVAGAPSMNVVAAALDHLGYQPVSRSEYLQFARRISQTRTVKIDLLTAQLDVLQNIGSIRADARRARPRAQDRPRLHAHPTDGALALDEAPLVIRIAGTRSDGQAAYADIRIPHAFTYLLMKLTAYRDRRGDADKNLGRHHALDIFRIAAMLTEDENDQVHHGLKRFARDAQVQSCLTLMQTDFSHAAASGLIAMREHPLWQNDQHIPPFLDLITDLLR